MKTEQKILILDFGSQYTQLIARRVRELGVYCEIFPGDMAMAQIESFAPQGIILSGGPESVVAANPLAPAAEIYTLGCPILGICYGMQTMAQQLGGEVTSAHKSEFGYAQVCVSDAKTLFANLQDRSSDKNEPLLDVWMSHGDRVNKCPSDFNVIATSANSPIAAMADVKRHFYGLQFHPEVTHTRQGKKMLGNFVKEICGCEKNWTPSNIAAESIAQIRQQVSDDGVVVGLSGGVDSAVTAAIIHQAIGDQLTCIFIDTGLLRLNEADEVEKIFVAHFGIHLIVVDAKDRFLKALKGVDDPEKKRKIIGEQFIRVFEKEAQSLNNVKWLGQGTIYPDVIESAAAKSGKTQVIKSHHNVGGLPEHMSLQLIEPLRDLFKDEVRRLGAELGLPAHLLGRHPFPGPGLALRVLGEIKPEFIAILQEADAIFLQELRVMGLYDEVAQAFAVFLPVKAVGVKGDARSYEYVIALRAVQSVDFMTAEWAPLPHDFLAAVSNRIINEIPQVARVVYDISSKPPATIEWE